MYKDFFQSLEMIVRDLKLRKTLTYFESEFWKNRGPKPRESEKLFSKRVARPNDAKNLRL